MYNDHSGVIRGNLNFGNALPPPRKGRLPLYNQQNMRALQEEADKLEKLGVLVKPEDVGVQGTVCVSELLTSETKWRVPFRNSLQPIVSVYSNLTYGFVIVR